MKRKFTFLAVTLIGITITAVLAQDIAVDENDVNIGNKEYSPAEKFSECVASTEDLLHRD